MSNAVAQSTGAVTVSPAGEINFDFADSVRRAAERQAKGTTRERQLLNFNKLTTAVCADYRSHFPAIYGKSERLPSEIFDKIQTTVQEFITAQLNRVNTGNAISFRRAFHHNSKEMEVTERVVSTGENKLTLQEQKLGIELFIGAAQKRLKDLEAKPTPDYEREKEVKQQLMKLEITKQFIVGELKHQQKLAGEIAKEAGK